MAEKLESNAGDLKVKVDVDVSEALKGLKAVTREAKRATAALNELETIKTKKVLLIKSKVRLSREVQERILHQVKEALDNGVALIFDDSVDYEWISVPSNMDVELTD